ncbi:hypothetical protein AAY80_257 [Stenotrophomonas phage vB_SmaS-DLP_6]|nr:hypothetical protein AAY80_257 [Stenotrophomonas phage vB_SmaS-DLP_6]
MSTTTTITEDDLTELRHKAAMFDFLAHTVSEMKIKGERGECDWVYQDGERSVEKFTRIVMNTIEMLVPDDEDEEEDDE